MPDLSYLAAVRESYDTVASTTSNRSSLRRSCVRCVGSMTSLPIEDDNLGGILCLTSPTCCRLIGLPNS